MPPTVQLKLRETNDQTETYAAESVKTALKVTFSNTLFLFSKRNLSACSCSSCTAIAATLSSLSASLDCKEPRQLDKVKQDDTCSRSWQKQNEGVKP